MLVIFVLCCCLYAIGKHTRYGPDAFQRSRTSAEVDAASDTASGHGSFLLVTSPANAPDNRFDPHSSTANVTGAVIPVTVDGERLMAVFRYDATFAQYDFAGVLDLAPGEQITEDTLRARSAALNAFLRTPSEHEAFVQYLRSGGIFTLSIALLVALLLWFAWFAVRLLVSLIRYGVDGWRLRVSAWRSRRAHRAETSPAAADLSAMSLAELETYTESRYAAAIDDFSHLITTLKNRFSEGNHP